MDFDFTQEAIIPTATDTLTIIATGALTLPTGTTAQRPSTPQGGWIRYNTSLSSIEFWNGTSWGVSGGSVTSVNTSQPAAGLTITGGPITGAGTFTFALANDLAALEGLATTGLAVRTAADTWATRSLTAPAAGLTITNPDGVSGNITFALANDLGALEALAATGIAVRTGADAWAQRTITGTAGQITVTDGNGVAANPTLSLPNVGSALTNFFGRVTTDAQGRVSGSSAAVTADITTALGYTPVNRAGDTMTGNLVLNADPVAALGAATRQFVLSSIDASVQARDNKESVRARSSTNITIASPGSAIGGVTPAVGERYLLDGQTTASEKGLYIWNGAAVPMTRAPDADTSAKVTSGMTVFVSEGTSGGQTWSLQTPDPIVLGTTALTFGQVGATTVYTGANGITVTGAVIAPTSTSLLASLHALAGTGIIAQTAAGVATARTITGTAGQIVVTDGNGVAANPTLTIASDAVLPGTAGVVVPTGTTAQETGTTNGALRYNTTTNKLRARVNGAWVDLGSGSVTSVDVTLPSIFSVAGGPITTTGTIAATLASQAQATVFAAPAGAAGAPSFRTLGYTDLPLALYRENPSAPTTPVASGANAVSQGSGTSALGAGSRAEGRNAVARVESSKAFSGGRFATDGDSQFGEYAMRAITTSATVGELFLDGAATRLVLADNQTMTFDILVVGRRTDAVGGSAGYKLTGVIKRDTGAGTVAIVGAVSTTVIAETNTAWNAAVVADTTNGSLRINVTGEAAKTVRWTAKVSTVEVTN